ncbi:MAG TPA: hypothetical protein VFU27_12065 [Terriglobales bacterium]|nr:hypothetical protein [Terriglobales bacterium]
MPARKWENMGYFIKSYKDRGDQAMDTQRLGSILITIAWQLIVFDCLVGVWIWVGFRTGSWLWFWWVVGTGFVALFLLWYGNHKRAAGERMLAETVRR